MAVAKTRQKKKSAPDTAGGTYTVLARRYRPQTFDEVVGQGHVAQALTNAINDGRVAHAYLFTGVRGVGKTSMARILAKALNCEKGPTDSPCNRCEFCEAITAGQDMDVLEIDGASNRGIDEVREIRQNATFRPSRSRTKIYIIDEVHMLTTEAFNALLKTLEEPPEHVKFIFATTEAQKIPATILSRCQRFDFASIPTEAIRKRLGEIIKAEKLKVDADALEAVARRAAGSMRDGQSLLDQVVAFGGGKIGVDDVQALLGTAADQQVLELIQTMAGGDCAAALQAVEEAARRGTHLGQLTRQLMDACRDLMVLASCKGGEVALTSIPSREAEGAGKLAAEWGLPNILAGMQVLSEASYRMRTAGAGRTHLEMAVVEICQLDQLATTAEMVGRLEQLVAGGAPVAAPGRRPLPASRSGGGPTAAPSAGSPATQRPADDLNDAWGRVLAELNRQRSAKITALLSTAGPQEFDGRQLVVVFPEANRWHWQQFENPENRKVVESAVTEALGPSVEVQLVLARSEPAAPPDPSPPSREAPSDDAPAMAPGQYRRELSQAMADPVVQRALEEFGGRIVKVEPRGRESNPK